MKIPYTLMESAGNRILIVCHSQGTFPDLSCLQARTLCNPSTGPGADQIMELWPLDTQDQIKDSNPDTPARLMAIWNTDGSRAEACGNGSRCVVAWLHPPVGIPVWLKGPVGMLEGWIVPRGPNPPQTIDAIHWHPCHENGEEDVRQSDKAWAPLVCVRHPYPHILGTVRLQTRSWIDCDSEREITVEGFHVDAGNPHLIMPCKPPPFQSPWREWMHLPDFPHGINISFVWVQGSACHVQTWERGVGPSLACGSAACSVAHVLWQGGAKPRINLDANTTHTSTLLNVEDPWTILARAAQQTSRSWTVPLALHMPGGDLFVQHSPQGWMHSAPTRTLSSGDFYTHHGLVPKDRRSVSGTQDGLFP